MLPLSERLRRSREAADADPAATRAMTLWVDPDAHIASTSAGEDRWLGFLRAELVGMPIRELVHPDDMPRLQLDEQLETEPHSVAVGVISRDGVMIQADIIRYPATQSGGTHRMDVLPWL